MKHGIYTILDKVAGINAVLQLPNDETAARYFKTSFKNVKSFADNAADYVGMRLGWIDTETGILEQEQVEIVDCYDYLKSLEGAKNEQD